MDGGFDFTLHMRRLCADVCALLPEFAHVDMTRVAIRFCQARKPARHGLQATLTPLRFTDGALTTRRGGRDWTVERLYDSSGREMLYLLSFYLPRFLDRSFEEKLSTVVHELWHVGPRFDGDLRRHDGRCWAHGHSQEKFNALARQLALKWLSLAPPPESHEFLRLRFRELARRHGRVFGQKISTPKLVHAS